MFNFAQMFMAVNLPCYLYGKLNNYCLFISILKKPLYVNIEVFSLLF